MGPQMQAFCSMFEITREELEAARARVQLLTPDFPKPEIILLAVLFNRTSAEGFARAIDLDSRTPR